MTDQTSDDTTTEPKQTRPFADVLLDMNRGRTHNEASSRLQDLVEAVMATGKKGQMVLVINVSKSKAHGQVEITDELRVKTPSADRAASIFFVTDDNNLSRTDPNQLELGLRDVTADAGERAARKAK